MKALYFGGPARSGPINGLQAEKARVPFANVGLVRIPEELGDDQALLCSDIWPTGWHAAELARIHDGVTVAVLGCGTVGLMAIASARLMGAGRVFAIDCVPSRLAMARMLGAEVIDFDVDDPVEVVLALTDGIGVDRVIDAVGVDAEAPHDGPAAKKARRQAEQARLDVAAVAPDADPDGDLWHPGDAPAQALEWAVDLLAKAGTLAIVGVYPEAGRFFSIGRACHKNLTLRMGTCDHRRYIPRLLEMVRAGVFDPSTVLTHVQPFDQVIAAYQAFDRRADDWIKVELRPHPKVAA